MPKTDDEGEFDRSLPYDNRSPFGVVTWDGYLEKMEKRGLRPDGTVIDAGDPIAPPIGWKDTPEVWQLVRNMIASEMLKAHAESEGFETEEEANDFGEDDPEELDDMSSGYEDDGPVIGSEGRGTRLPPEQEAAPKATMEDEVPVEAQSSVEVPEVVARMGKPAEKPNLKK